MEAALPIKSKEEIEKEKREEEIKKKAKFLLEKHFEGRKYEEDKIKKWSNSILEDMNDFLTLNYPSFGFGIFLFVSEPISYYAKRQSVFAPKTDSSICEIYKAKYLRASLRVSITKLKNQKFDVENINLDHLLKVNQIYNDSFERRCYDKNVEKYLENAVNDINTYLLKFDELGHSFHQGFVFKNNTNKISFFYKFGKMRFFPYCSSYANDSLLAHLFLFFVSN